MLGVFMAHLFRFRHVALFFLLFNHLILTEAFALPINPDVPIVIQLNTFEDIGKHLESLSDEEAFEDLAQMLVNVRQCAIEAGIDFPSLADIAKEARMILIENGIDLPQDMYEQFVEIFERVQNEFNQRNGLSFNLFPSFQLCKHKHKHKPHHSNQEEGKISGKMAIGFCKFLAGALCSIIPHPVAKGVGISLIASGIQDMTSETAKKEQKQQLIIQRHPKTVR